MKSDIFQSFSRAFLSEKILREYKSKPCTCGHCTDDGTRSIVTAVIRHTSFIIGKEPHTTFIKQKIINSVLSETEHECENVIKLMKYSATKCLINCTKILTDKILSTEKKSKKKAKKDTAYRHPKLRIIKN